jgi:spore germination cell wall hydrolase CwlJ-like protein
MVTGMSTNSGNFRDDINYDINHYQLTKTIVKQAKYMREIQCLARNVYYESRGESWEGQMAVAKVTLNRVESDLFPDTICGVVEEKYQVRGYTVCQFSWYCESWNDKKLKLTKNHQSYQVALDAILHKDVPEWMTSEVFWFHTKQVKPKWRRIHEKVAVVDNHIFYQIKK